MNIKPAATVSIRGLTKRFLSTLALDNVDLTIQRGEIHALVGENGAGKSTLIKILAGIHQADEGVIKIEGKTVNPSSEAVPIAFVHQDLGLVDTLSIGENVALVAGFPRKLGLISWKEVWSQAVGIYETMGIDLPDPRALVGTLSASGKAILGIVRALSQGASIVVLDEPTAALPGPDAEHLFEIVKRLRAGGTSILYVSHRLNELAGFADSVTIFRDGRHVKTNAMADVTVDEIVRDMLGKDLTKEHRGDATPISGPPLLEISGLCTSLQGPIDFSIGAGEVVGLVGLRGAGHEAIGRAIFGAEHHRAGTIRLDDTAVMPNFKIAERIAMGIAFLPGDRLGESSIGGMSLIENLYPNIGNGLRPTRRKMEEEGAARALEHFDVRPRNAKAMIDWLSGGNQQKVFVGRWIATGARLFIMEEPTAGIDIGAKTLIHRILREIVSQGAAALIVSSDFEEVATLCDRALVVARGKIAAELSGDNLTLESLIATSSRGPVSSLLTH